MNDFENMYKSIQEGWLPIARKLHHELLKIAPDYKIFQIKEKFGGLRYYTDGSIGEEGERLIAEAERECSKTCEFCGSTDEVATAGPSWIKTLCKVCHSKR